MTAKMPEIPPAKRDLFAAYARFEFALKEAGFLVGKEGEKASPNWHLFSTSNSLANLLDDLAQDADVAALIAKPPRQQVIHNKALDWVDAIPAPITSARDLLLATKAVRDNLFHGGKQGEDPRDEMLCRAAIKILLATLDRHPEVKARFNGEY